MTVLRLNKKKRIKTENHENPLFDMAYACYINCYYEGSQKMRKHRNFWWWISGVARTHQWRLICENCFYQSVMAINLAKLLG